MTRVLTTVSNLIGALTALAVAVVGFFSQVGLVTVLVRVVVTGVVVTMLFRIIGLLVVRALVVRFAARSLEPAATDPGAERQR